MWQENQFWRKCNESVYIFWRLCQTSATLQILIELAQRIINRKEMYKQASIRVLITKQNVSLFVTRDSFLRQHH